MVAWRVVQVRSLVPSQLTEFDWIDRSTTQTRLRSSDARRIDRQTVPPNFTGPGHLHSREPFGRGNLQLDKGNLGNRACRTERMGTVPHK